MPRFLLLVLPCVFAACAQPTPPAAGPAAPTAATAAVPAASAVAPTPVRDIDVAALKADLDGGAVKLLVDVRTPDEFAGGHIPGAKNIPIGDLEARISELGATDTEVTVVCEVGGRSARAAATLAKRGFRAVNVLGGTSSWRAAGYPVE